jgi:hypothetical protein
VPLEQNSGVVDINCSLYRARKADIKSVEAVESKSMGAKRTATDGQARPRRKRQKTEAYADAAHEKLRKDGQTRYQTSSQVFRFMDLPGGVYL